MDEDLRTYLVRGGSAPARLARELDDDDKTVASLSNWSSTQRWAWDELQRRVRVCLAAGRLPAGVLAHWAATVAAGRELPRNNENEDRDWRVLAVVNVLVRRGESERKAVHQVAEEISRTPEAVYSILRKMRAGPFVKNRASVKNRARNST